jgi:5-methylcytosine-specific restriction endonuclease McrA
LGLAMRYRVLRRDRFRCQICGRSPAKDLGVELHVDHIVPWSKGGQNTEENLRTLCSKCNLGRGQKTKCFDPKPLRLNASYLNGSSHIANAAFLPQ